MPRTTASTDPTVSTALIVATSGYVAVTLIANVMSSRIVMLAGLSLDAGTLLYPLVFTLRDVVHKSGGLAVARLVVITTAALNALMVAAFWMASRLPADPAVGAQSEFGRVLVPLNRIVIGSLVAQLIAELIDTEVYRRVAARWGEERQWLRVVASNSVSIPVDTVVFAVIAFAGTPAGVSMWPIVWANILVKAATTLVTWPLIYAVPRRLVRTA